MSRAVPFRTIALSALLTPLVLGAASCRAERTLRITSDPPGAEVWLDETPRGATPLEIEFHHYGDRRITYRHPGYGTASMLVAIEAPWYGRFPADLLSEVLLPLGWEDKHTVHAVLRRGTGALEAPMLRSALDRAEALRRAGPRGPGDLPPVIAVEPQASSDEP